MGKGAIIIGLMLVLFGTWLALQISNSDAPKWLIIYPLGIIGIGIALMLLWKEESKIEERKDLKPKKLKK